MSKMAWHDHNNPDSPFWIPLDALLLLFSVASLLTLLAPEQIWMERGWLVWLGYAIAIALMLFGVLFHRLARRRG